MQLTMSIVGVLLFIGICMGHYGGGSFKEVKRPGPQYIATKGKPWPQPQLLTTHDENFLIVRPAIFRFEIVGKTCDLIEQALKRYYAIILKSNGIQVAPYSRVHTNKTWKAESTFNGYLDVLKIHLMSECEVYPHDSMDELYEIKIDTPDLPGEGILISNTNWGILRGLETFSQLIHITDDYTALQIKSTLILDFPRFGYRSVLLDTSRHFLSKRIIYQNLDLMAMNKFNVFHWHVVDDQAFPYQSKLFPNLSDKGAYHPYTHVYTQQDVADIIEYARVRGIRVVSEFDTPGHTQAWGPGVPGLLTECYSKQGKPDGTYGPIDPTRPENFEFLKKFFQEVATVYPDKYIHLGGDEVDYSCWESNPLITQFMQSNNFTKLEQVEEYYMQKLVDIVQTFPQNNSYLVWQEVIDNGVKVDNSTIVHVWKRVDIEGELAHVTSLGYRTLLSACWYLNYIDYGIDWGKFYQCDPHNFNGTDAQKILVIGGGPAMWAEYVDSTNIIQRLWPRAALPAERLWSNATVTDRDNAARRLEEHRCRLLKRGYQVQPPNGPGFCLVSWD